MLPIGWILRRYIVALYIGGRAERILARCSYNAGTIITRMFDVWYPTGLDYRWCKLTSISAAIHRIHWTSLAWWINGQLHTRRWGGVRMGYSSYPAILMSGARHLVVSRICKTSQGLVDSLVFSCGYFPHVCVDNMCFAECDLFGFCRWATATSITVVISSSARRCWDHCEFSAAIMVIAFPFISGHNWSCARIDLGARHTHVNHHGWPCSFLYV